MGTDWADWHFFWVWGHWNGHCGLYHFGSLGVWVFGYEHRHWSLGRGAIPRVWILLGSIVLQSVMSICEINEELFFPKMDVFKLFKRRE